MGLDNPLHIAVLLILVLLLFGAKRLPEIGRSLGVGMREFKDSISGASSTPTLPQSTQQQPQTPAQAAATQAPAAPQPASAPAEPSHQA